MNLPVKMEWQTALLLLSTIVLLSAGQVLFKWASVGISLREPRTLFAPSLLAALATYGVATILWILVLKRLPLSYAFPFYGLTFLLVPLLAHLLLHEKVGYQTLLGGVLILAGIFVSNWGRTA